MKNHYSVNRAFFMLSIHQYMRGLKILSIGLVLLITGGVAFACNIKGNISYGENEKIYHVPGCASYNATKINTSYGERWFCSESDARAAGWRKAYNCPGTTYSSSSSSSTTRTTDSYMSTASITPSYTYNPAPVTCSSNECELSDACYTKPAHASCVTGDPSNARVCNTGYVESGNNCVTLPITPKEPVAKKPNPVQATQKTSPPPGVVDAMSSLYAREPVDFTYWNQDKNMHCDHNRPGTNYIASKKMCLCPSGREFRQQYGCGTVKGKVQTNTSKAGSSTIPSTTTKATTTASLYIPTQADLTLLDSLKLSLISMNYDQQVALRSQISPLLSSMSGREYYFFKELLSSLAPEDDLTNILGDLFSENNIKNRVSTTYSVVQDPIVNGGSYRVSKVVDGDTVHLESNGDHHSVRLIGIDAPERDEAGYAVAQSYLHAMVFNKNVTFNYDETQSANDKYDRYLGYISINAKDMGLALLEQGIVKEYTYDKPYKYQSAYQDAEKTAQNRKIGLWE